MKAAKPFNEFLIQSQISADTINYKLILKLIKSELILAEF